MSLTFKYSYLELIVQTIKECSELLGDFKLNLATKAVKLHKFSDLLFDIRQYKVTITQYPTYIDEIYDDFIEYLVATYEMSKYEFVEPDYVKRERLVKQGKLIRPKPIRKTKQINQIN